MSNNLGKTIKEARIAKGLSQVKLAEVSGVACRQIINIESERTKQPHVLTVKLLAQALELDVKELVEGANDREKKSIGEVIKEARIAKEMTQGQLAIFSGITQTQISNIETGRTKRPQLLTLHSLSEYLGLEEVMEHDEERKLTREQSYFIGKKIEELRLSKKLSRKQLSNLSGVSEIQIRNIEQGKTKNPHLSTIELLDEALDYELSKKDK